MACLAERALESDLRDLGNFPDDEILKGVRSHADPEWWKQDYIRSMNQAYLRRWGSYLRREARRRGLL